MNSLFSFIINPPPVIWLLIVKVLFIGISLCAVIFMVYALLNTAWLKKRVLWDATEISSRKPYFKSEKNKKRWNKINIRLKSNLGSEHKLAIIEADNMLDEVLKEIGYGGATLGEKLNKITQEIIPNLQDILQAHKIRSDIVHDPDYRLALEEAKKILGIYEQALKNLEAL
ncbi:hypothetical protein ACFL11_01010 [Patescibacteria group bacterium]